MKAKITIEALDSGFIVTRLDWNPAQYWTRDKHRTAEATLTGALGLAARALGYHGTIDFGRPPSTTTLKLGDIVALANEAAAGWDDARAVEVPVVSDPAAYAPPGVPFDAEEPPLRAGTAKPGDKL